MAVLGPRFILKGFEPPTVRQARRGDRMAYWNAVSQYVIEAKDRELRQGLDRFGDPMAALSLKTISHRRSAMGPADPSAPPLQPAHGLSRTRSLFVAQPTAAIDGVTCYWSYDDHTRVSWGEILKYHRAGRRGLPIRDVIGLSPASLATVNSQSAAWWEAYRAGSIPVPTATRELMPTPEPRFMVEVVKRYKPQVAAKAVPKVKKVISQIKINDRIYTLQGGSAARVNRMIAGGTFSGFRTREQILAERAARGGR